jgi:two-component system response regulator MprA
VRVLIAEDDRQVRESLERSLRHEGYEVSSATDGVQALEAVARDDPALLIVDVAMPHVDGLTVVRALRAQADHRPVLVLTARAEVSDRVAGLDAGADDYLAKPFALDELLARMRALLRRRSPPPDETYRLADLTLDPATREVSRAGHALQLTKMEFDLLEVLLRNARIVLERHTIYTEVWGYDFGAGSKTLDVLIGYLRRKLEEGGRARLIHTVRGVGYVARETPP